MKTIFGDIEHKYMTVSIPRCPLRSHSMVHRENNSYFVGIGTIRYVERTCIFQPISPLITFYQRYLSVL